jgi:hypothetical protein
MDRLLTSSSLLFFLYHLLYLKAHWHPQISNNNENLLTSSPCSLLSFLCIRSHRSALTNEKLSKILTLVLSFLYIYHIDQWKLTNILTLLLSFMYLLSSISLANTQWKAIKLLLFFLYHLSNTSSANTYNIDQWKALKHPDLVAVLYVPPIQHLIG